MKNSDGLRKIGEQLYNMRKSRGLTQEKLAVELGINAKMISIYENGNKEMGALLYDKILIFFGQKTSDPQTMELLQIFSSLTSEAKQHLIAIATVLKT